MHFTYSLDVNISLDEEQIASKCKSNKVQIVKPYVYELPENKRVSKFRPVVVGFGPAGMFAGLILALSGLKPIILERGKDVEARKADVQKFWREKSSMKNRTYSSAKAVQAHFLTESSQRE